MRVNELSFCFAEVDIIDRILSEENQEIERLISSMQDTADLGLYQQKTVSGYGIDEEEYDKLFMELISKQILAERSTPTVGNGGPGQDMDISAE